MRSKRLLGKFFGTLCLAGAFMFALSPVSSVQASIFPINTDRALIDPFFSLSLKPEGVWWTTFVGPLDGQQGEKIENTTCAYNACVELKREGWNKFARLTIKQQVENEIFSLSELTDVRDGDTPEVGRWTPTAGHPVVLTSQIRFSPGHNLDGSGVVGSAGIWLWDNPGNIQTHPFFIANGIGITFNMSGGIPFFTGLTVGKIESSFPSYQNPVTGITMSEWNNFTMIWKAATDGTQSVDFYINGQSAGSTTLAAPLSNLSVEIWLDNQRLSFAGVERLPVPEDKYFDVDNFSVVKL